MPTGSSTALRRRRPCRRIDNLPSRGIRDAFTAPQAGPARMGVDPSSGQILGLARRGRAAQAPTGGTGPHGHGDREKPDGANANARRHRPIPGHPRRAVRTWMPRHHSRRLPCGGWRCVATFRLRAPMTSGFLQVADLCDRPDIRRRSHARAQPSRNKRPPV